MIANGGPRLARLPGDVLHADHRFGHRGGESFFATIDPGRNVGVTRNAAAELQWWGRQSCQAIVPAAGFQPAGPAGMPWAPSGHSQDWLPHINCYLRLETRRRMAASPKERSGRSP